MSKLTLEQRIQKAHVWLMGSPEYCLYSGIFMMGKTEVRDDVPTACTNGRDVKYGRKFCEALSEQELRALILHENLHKAFRHLVTWHNLYEDNPKLANMACDYVINLMIHDSDPEGKNVQLPKGGLLDQKYRGMDAQTVFRMLKKECSGGGGGGGGEGFDEHDWDGAQELTADEKRQIERDVDQALRQGAMLAGKMKGNVPREITEALESKVDWRRVMQEFVSTICQGKDEATWRKPSRRWISSDVYMPSTVSESVGWLVIAADTSGSIDQAMLSQWLGEVEAVCNQVRPEGVHLMYWDSGVCRHEIYTQDQFDSIRNSTKPAGGGGTDPQCIVNYMKEHKVKAECCLVLTDGYVCSWGVGWDCPVLWGITTKTITAEVGTSVHVS